MIDHDIGDRFHAALKQLLQHGPMLLEAAVAIVQPEILLGIVAGAQLSRVGWRWEPDQVETRFPNRWGKRSDNFIPVLFPECRKRGRTAMPIRFPIESLQHYAIVLKPALRLNG